MPLSLFEMIFQLPCMLFCHILYFQFAVAILKRASSNFLQLPNNFESVRSSYEFLAVGHLSTLFKILCQAYLSVFVDFYLMSTLTMSLD